MRLKPNLLRRHALVWAAMIISGSCSMDKSPPQIAATGDEPAQASASGDGSAQVATSADEPAQVILLAGPTADWFLDLDPPPPPDGGVVVAGSDEGAVFAFVLGRDMEDADKRLRDLTVAEIEGCGRGGLTCCDAERKTYVLDSEFESQRSWLLLGERCAGLPAEQRIDEGAPVGDANAGVVEVEPEIMRALAAYGVTHPFMTLAEETGNGRILVDPSYEDSDLGLAPPIPNRPGFQDPSSIVLAGHLVSGRPRCVSRVNSCRQEEGDRCNEGRRHWFRWYDTRDRWCQMGDRCRC